MKVIDEQQVIDLLENCTDLQEAKSIIARGALHAVNNWIPVSEGLPRPFEDVWVQHRGGGMFVDCIDDENTWCEHDARDIVAWHTAQKPEPYYGREK